MTKEEAWAIIKQCQGWNTCQKSEGELFRGKRDKESELLDNKRIALAKAWKIVGENE